MLSGSAEQLIGWYASQLKDDSLLDEDSKRIRLESDEDLVKIVTIFVAKGLEYPIVFLPFFFLPRQPDLNRNLPLYHDQDRDYVRGDDETEVHIRVTYGPDGDGPVKKSERDDPDHPTKVLKPTDDDDNVTIEEKDKNKGKE